MIQLTSATVANAINRARSLRPRVSRISDNEIAVTCRNADHAQGHIVRFEHRADGTLWAECVIRSTGELCPSALGKRPCYHALSGVTLFLALEAMRAAEKTPSPVAQAKPLPALSTKRHRQQDDALLALQLPRKKAEYVRGFQI